MPVTRNPSSHRLWPRASYKGGHTCRLYNLISAEYLQKEMYGGGHCPPSLGWLSSSEDGAGSKLLDPCSRPAHETPLPQGSGIWLADLLAQG